MRLVNGHGVAAADPGSPVVRTGAAVDPLIIRLAAVLSGAHRTAMEMNIHSVAPLDALGGTPAATSGSRDRRSALETTWKRSGETRRKTRARRISLNLAESAPLSGPGG
jgi:hypothetical protein